MKNLALPIFAFFLIVFASCSKPTVNNVSGNWCMTDYKSEESNESSDTTVETSFIDADWQQTTYANGQQEKIKGNLINYIPSLNLKSNGYLSRVVAYSYQTTMNDTIFVKETLTGSWNLLSNDERKDNDGIVLCVAEKIITKGKIRNGYLTIDTEDRSRYALEENYIVYKIDNYSNKKMVLTLDEQKTTQKIETSNIILERITDRNIEKYAAKYATELLYNAPN